MAPSHRTNNVFARKSLPSMIGRAGRVGPVQPIGDLESIGADDSAAKAVSNVAGPGRETLLM